MILQLLMAWFASKINRHQDQVIAYLREENRILQAKLKGQRMPLTDTERRRLAVLAHPIDRKALKDFSTIATPDTLQRWYRRLGVQVSSRKPKGKPRGRPRVAAEIEQLVVQMANENPRWGSRRLQGALSNLGHHIDNTTVRNILHRRHIDPASIRGKAGMSGSQCVTLHWEVLEASGCFVAQLSSFAPLWTVVTQLGRNLNARGVHLVAFIRRGARSMPALLAPPCEVQRFGFLTGLAPRCRLVCGTHQCVSDGTFPSMRLVFSYPVFHPRKASPMQRERDPPGPNVLKLAMVTRRPCYGRRVSKARQAAASGVGSCESNSDDVAGCAQRRGSYADSAQTAA